MKRVNAFTLAEVLITLTIIGVVASMTIPGLINDTNNKELKVSWKKLYGEFSNATNLIKLDNGGTLEPIMTNSKIIQAYAPYMNSVKECDINDGVGAVSGGCWHAEGDWHYLNKTEGESRNHNSGLILSNGVLLVVGSGDPKYCNGITQNCGYIIVDVNGKKLPNTVGKDIYGFNIFNNRIEPFGGPYENPDNSKDYFGCDPNSLNKLGVQPNGYGCSTTVLYN